MVTPEEIERVDVLYGPYSAAYPGNSAGAVVDFRTRMPAAFEAHVKLAALNQAFSQYATSDHYRGTQGSASVGDRSGAVAWWIDVARMDNAGQPLVFANRTMASGSASGTGLAVTGAVADRNPSGAPWWIFGATNQIRTRQDHAKVKLAWDVTATLRASYTLGWWRNDSVRKSDTYLRDAAGAPVWDGDVNHAITIGGRRFVLRPSDLAPALGELEHLMHGLSLKSHTRATWDWELAASGYDYAHDLARVPTAFVRTPDQPAPGTVTDLHGSGWNTLAFKALWRPSPAHVVDLGLQRDSAHLRSRVFAAANWIDARDGAGVSVFNGCTRLDSLYAQDAWRLDARWRALIGLRLERWSAFDGELGTAGGMPLRFGTRLESTASPKAALSFRVDDAWWLKAALGKAVRNPTAAELFQGTVLDQQIVNSDPSLHAERSWTGELTAERSGEHGQMRATLFHERTRDALYTQPLNATVSTVQNVDRIRTRGLELAASLDPWPQLSLAGSATYADSVITANAGYPASVGRHQPRVPLWRANASASWKAGDGVSATIGMRYSGRQYGALDNSDSIGRTYMGVSNYLVADVRLRWRFAPQWALALGVDNLGNENYWAFHPYAQRTLVAQVRWDR
jgi:iron complex outermembrane receptor protein